MGRALGLDKCPVFEETGDAYVTTEFGKNIPDYPTEGKTGDHWGLDIVRRVNNSNTIANICAIADGIIFAQRTRITGFSKEYGQGNCVYILHDDGLTITKYYHLKYGSMPSFIADNVRVKKGQVLGTMGNTGYSYGAHLHFQVEKLNAVPEKITPSISGTPVDPEPYLKGDIIIDKDEELYQVVIGEFDAKEKAEAVQSALKILGTASRVEKK